MSVFTNPASHSIEQARAYTAAILDLLGSKDPMDVLGRTPDAVRHAVSGLTEQQLSQREAPGKWSIRHVVRHLADSDLVWGYRVRMILAQDRPTLTGYDQDLWAERLRYDQAPADMALEELRVLRRSNSALIVGASPGDLAARRPSRGTRRGERGALDPALCGPRSAAPRPDRANPPRDRRGRVGSRPGQRFLPGSRPARRGVVCSPECRRVVAGFSGPPAACFSRSPG